MIINKRIIDFSLLLEKIEHIRLTKNEYLYHAYLKEFPQSNKCLLCELPTSLYSLHVKNNLAYCASCYLNYIDNEDYLQNFKDFESKVISKNHLADAFSSSLKTKKLFDLELANQLFKSMKLDEIELMIGLPKRYGSFDYGIESGEWKIENFRIEIWFKHQFCTEVELI